MVSAQFYRTRMNPRLRLCFYINSRMGSNGKNRPPLSPCQDGSFSSTISTTGETRYDQKHWIYGPGACPDLFPYGRAGLGPGRSQIQLWRSPAEVHLVLRSATIRAP